MAWWPRYFHSLTLLCSFLLLLSHHWWHNLSFFWMDLFAFYIWSKLWGWHGNCTCFHWPSSLPSICCVAGIFFPVALALWPAVLWSCSWWTRPPVKLTKFLWNCIMVYLDCFTDWLIIFDIYSWPDSCSICTEILTSWNLSWHFIGNCASLWIDVVKMADLSLFILINQWRWKSRRATVTVIAVVFLCLMLWNK